MTPQIKIAAEKHRRCLCRAGLLVLIVSVLSIINIPAAGAQQSVSETTEDFTVFSVKNIAGLGIPIGTRADVFSLGAGTFVLGGYSMSFYPPLSFNAGAGYQFAPIKAEDSVSMMYGGAGVGLQYLLGESFAAGGWVNGGYGYGLLNSDAAISGGAPYGMAGLFASYFFNPQLSLSLEGNYRYFQGLYQDVQVGVGVSYFFNFKRIKAVDFAPPVMDPVYPLLQRWYTNNPVGSVPIRNVEEKPIEEVTVTMQIPEFTEEPREAKVPSRLNVGAQADALLFADFAELGLEVTEPKTVEAQIEVSYKYGSFTRRQEYEDEVELTILPGRSIRWDDMRKISLLVTENDPPIAGAMVSLEDELMPAACNEIDPFLMKAMGLYLTMAEGGYRLDEESESPFRSFISNPDGLDTVQLPYQTVERGKGDSAELSALFASAAAAAGFEPYFLVLPEAGMIPVLRVSQAGEESREEL
ncbi:MAG: MipA/OmpV family protein [Spirochaetales bacterium]|nr:MipA/OmpV family protein [Spirochaetales bacterium]MCF7939739.1 MipA/OmpV family protein [Spirochaetales bacterium]